MSDKTTYAERYSGAVRATSLASSPRTNMSPTDVLFAVGVADRELTTGVTSLGANVHQSPMAAAIFRVLVGGDSAVHAAVRVMADHVWKHAKSAGARQGVKLKRAQAIDMARAVLAWHRNGVCKPCGGHGYSIIPGTTTLSERECEHCNGKGKVPLERQFPLAHIELARWLAAEVEIDCARVAAQAMTHHASSLDFLRGLPE